MFYTSYTFSKLFILEGKWYAVLVLQVLEFLKICHLETKTMVKIGQILIFHCLDVLFIERLGQLCVSILNINIIVGLLSAHFPNSDISLTLSYHHRLESQANTIKYKNSPIVIDLFRLFHNLLYHQQIIVLLILLIMLILYSEVLQSLILKFTKIKQSWTSW